MTLNASDANTTDYGTVIGLEDAAGALLNETAALPGHDILLESGSSSTLGSKLILDSQLIEIESGINDGEIPSPNFGDNSVFPTYTPATQITIKSVGRVSLQDESPKTFQTIEGATGDDLLLEGSVHIGGFAIDGSNSSGANANSAFILEGSVPRGSRPPDNEGGFLLREDAVILNEGDNLLMTEEISNTSSGGFLAVNGTDGAVATVNGALTQSTTLVVDTVTGTLAVGQVITVKDLSAAITDADSADGISTNNSLTITAVASQTSVTVSEPITVANNIVLLAHTNAGKNLYFESGTYSSVLGTAAVFIPPGQKAKSFNSTKTTFDTTDQTFDVIAGDS